MAKTKYILSIDGGGIRGLIPAMILAEIEKKTNKRIADIFHLMAGSSSGGLVVAGLCLKDKQCSANDIANMMKDYGPKVVNSPDCDSSELWKGADYLNNTLKKVLDKHYGYEPFSKISNNLLITSYDIFNNEPYIYRSWDKDMKKNKQLRLRHILLASMATPTIFLPIGVRKTPREVKIIRTLVSGAMYANNPAACAYAEAKKLFPNDKIVLLSIGTGKTKMNLTLEKTKSYEETDWIDPLKQIMFSSSNGINCLLSTLLENDFIRIQGKASESSSELDNTTPENIKALEKEAAVTIRENNKIIDQFCSSVS